ncbi:response regulator transcription factor [Herbaspirillum sp. RV1423]|uniref:response regulator n=1 Tax=Herbaspirillum sp. RV1423 TaxID=1443993 RepID=UPI0004B9C83C|nr:response regulator transcription factor [Herbaspirillum sp. RV1423]
MIKILIADDHGMMREGLKRIIATTGKMMVVAEAVNGLEVLEKLGKADCNLLLLDLTMQGISGMDLIKQVKNRRPGLSILVLSMHNEGKIAAAALKAGARGYLTKDSDPDRLLEAIQKVAGGGRYIDPSMVDKIVFEDEENVLPHEHLSQRERQIFIMIAAGKSTGKIAAELFLSAKTVSTHKRRILEKMNADNAADLVRYSVAHQLTE